MSHDPLSSSFAKRALALNDSKLDRLYNERESLSIKRTSSAFSRQEDSNEETHLHSQDDHSGTLIIDSAAPQMSPRKNLSVKIYLDDDEAVALPPELTLSEAEGAKAQTFDFVVEPSLSEATTSFVDPSSQLFTDDGSSLATAGRGLTKKASIKLSKKTSDDRKQTQSFGWLVGGSLGVMGGQGWASKLVKSSTTDTIAEDTTLGFKAPIISAAPSRFPSRPSSASSSVRSVRPAPGGKRGFSSFLSIMKNASAAAAATSSSSKPRTLSFLQGAVRRINSKIKKKKTQKPTLTSAEILSFANDRADYWMMKREYLANRARMKILYKRVKGLVNRRSAADEAKDAGENLRLIREKEEKAMGIKSSSKTASAEGKTPLHLATLLKMKAFSRTEYPSAESEHEYRVSNDDDNFSASSDNPPSSDDRASPLSSFHVIDSQQGLRNHRDLDGERSRNMVAALFGTEVAKKAVCLRVGAVDPLALPDHHRPPPPPAKEKSIAGLSDIFTAPTKSYNSMHGGPMAGRIGSTTASSNKTPPGSALVKLRKMLRRHRERLGWSIYDLEQTRAIAIERDVKEAAAAAAKKVAEDKLDASAHQSPASSPKQSLNDEEAKASEAPSPHHHHRPRVTLPEEFELVENFQVASSPVSSPLNNHSFSPDPLAHSPLPHPSPSSQAGSFNHGTVKSPLALRVLAIWRDAPDSVKKILQGSHQVIPPAHFSPQESSSQIGQAGIVRGIKTPSPHPDHSRPTSRLSARSSPLPDTSPSLPTAPIGGLNSARVDIRSASPFEVIEEASQEEPIPETPLAIDKSLLAKFDQESPAISKAPSPVPPDVTTSSNKARPASPKPSTSKAIQANSRVIRPSSPLSSSKPHSSHAASQIPKGQKGASWAMETANLERRLLKAQLAETNVELPRAVRELLEELSFAQESGHHWNWNEVRNEWTVPPSEILRESSRPNLHPLRESSPTSPSLQPQSPNFHTEGTKQAAGAQREMEIGLSQGEKEEKEDEEEEEEEDEFDHQILNDLTLVVERRKMEKHLAQQRSRLTDFSASIARRAVKEGLNAASDSSVHVPPPPNDAATIVNAPTSLSREVSSRQPAALGGMATILQPSSASRPATSASIRRNASEIFSNADKETFSAATAIGGGGKRLGRTVSSAYVSRGQASHMHSSADSALSRVMGTSSTFISRIEIGEIAPLPVRKAISPTASPSPSPRKDEGLIATTQLSPSSPSSQMESTLPANKLKDDPTKLQTPSPRQGLVLGSKAERIIDRLYPKESTFVTSARLAYATKEHHPPYAAIHISATERLERFRPGTAPIGSSRPPDLASYLAQNDGKTSKASSPLPSPSEPPPTAATQSASPPITPSQKYRRYLNRQTDGTEIDATWNAQHDVSADLRPSTAPVSQPRASKRQPHQSASLHSPPRHPTISAPKSAFETESSPGHSPPPPALPPAPTSSSHQPTATARRPSSSLYPSSSRPQSHNPLLKPTSPSSPAPPHDGDTNISSSQRPSTALSPTFPKKSGMGNSRWGHRPASSIPQSSNSTFLRYMDESMPGLTSSPKSNHDGAIVTVKSQFSEASLDIPLDGLRGSSFVLKSRAFVPPADPPPNPSTSQVEAALDLQLKLSRPTTSSPRSNASSPSKIKTSNAADDAEGTPKKGASIRDKMGGGPGTVRVKSGSIPTSPRRRSTSSFTSPYLPQPPADASGGGTRDY